MGYIRHHCIVVTGGYREGIEAIRKAAVGIFCKMTDTDSGCPISEILYSPMNGYYTFMVGPDGSNEGWRTSNDGNSKRDIFKSALRASDLDWFEVHYGGDDGGAVISAHDQDEDIKEE